MTSPDLKKKALQYYQNLQYKSEDSAPLQHPYFPMAFNMSAGFVQLEPYIHSKKPVIDPKIVTVQKCIRHFDLSRSGFDKSHLTFFEMWGALTLGRPDRLELLTNIWRFMTSELNIAPNRLYITVFGGASVAGKFFNQDSEALMIWNELGVKEDHIVLGNETNTFWFQGGNNLDDKTKASPFEEKLCGLQTEMYYDRTQAPCSSTCSPFCSCDRWLEIANNLNITHEFIPNSKQFRPLEIPATETVFGVERLLSVLEDRPSIWDISEFVPILDYLRQRTLLSPNHQYVLIDRLRPLLFLVSEGLPNIGKNGRARIVRLLVRDVLSILYLVTYDQAVIAETLQSVLQLLAFPYLDFYPKLDSQIHAVIKPILDHHEIYQNSIRHAIESIRNSKLRGEFTVINKELLQNFRINLGIPEFLVIKEFPELIHVSD